MTPDQLWSDLRSMQYHIEHKKDKIFGRYFFQYSNKSPSKQQHISWTSILHHQILMSQQNTPLLQSTFAKVSYWTINTHARPEHFRQRTRIHAHIVTMLQFLNTEVEMWCFRSNTKVRHCLQCGSWYLCSRLVICPTSQRVICTNQDFTTALYNVCTDMTNESTVL